MYLNNYFNLHVCPKCILRTFKVNKSSRSIKQTVIFNVTLRKSNSAPWASAGGNYQILGVQSNVGIQFLDQNFVFTKLGSQKVDVQLHTWFHRPCGHFF